MTGPRWSIGSRRRRSGALIATSLLALVLLASAPAADAAFDDLLFVFTLLSPPQSPTEPPVPPPLGFLGDPCGLAVDSAGAFYVSDHYHGVVDKFAPPAAPYADPPVFQGQPYKAPAFSVAFPCGLAIDSTGARYLNNFHHDVTRFSGTVIDSQTPTGVAVDPATDDVYVDTRDAVAIYDSSGAQLGTIAQGEIEDGYGIAVSGFPGTAGNVYVPDAETDTVKVLGPGGALVQTITGPPGDGFRSLADSAVAVDDTTGEVYVIDTGAPQFTESPLATVYVCAAGATTCAKRLKHDVIDGGPSGLAVDNSGGAGQGRVYLTSGNSDRAAGTVYAYPPGAGTNAAAPPVTPPGSAFNSLPPPAVSIGGATPPEPSTDIVCVGDACQILVPPPPDPTLTTLLRGLGNPRIRYVNLHRRCRPYARAARRFKRLSRRNVRKARHTEDPRLARWMRAKAKRLAKRSKRAARAARRCSNRGGRVRSEPAKASAASVAAPGRTGWRSSAEIFVEDNAEALLHRSTGTGARAAVGGSGAGLLPGGDGFSVSSHAGSGGPATQAGSHPFDFTLAVAADPGQDLRDLEIDLPPGLVANLVAVPLCTGPQFGENTPNPRTSPYEASKSGENCPDSTQIGTVEVDTSTDDGETRTFGLFNLTPDDGSASRLAAYPYGLPGGPADHEPLIFDTRISLDSFGAYAQRLVTSDISPDLELRGLKLTIWGAPWLAAHNGERGDCLNEREPSFPWAKCSVSSIYSPLAYLTMPTGCGETLPFTARSHTWQDPALDTATAINRDANGAPVPVTGCEILRFSPRPDGFLTSTQGSSAAGFEFRLQNDVDQGLLNPHIPVQSHARRAEVVLPEGVTLNAAMADGLAVCDVARYAAETAFNAFGDGCPTESKIGEFHFRTPLYLGLLKGSIFLARPDDKGTKSPGAENPFDSLVTVYLIAKSAQRGILIKLAGKIAPDPATGQLTATFENLPQFPYTDLQVQFKSGQRAPLVTPDLCGGASTTTVITPWSGGPSATKQTASPILSGPGRGPCPDPGGPPPPFEPKVVAGGVNSNVGSYTPYFVGISREDDEQLLTSYSLVIPEGITGRLAGIPFCPESAIAAARQRGGFAETADPSCPQASLVGSTYTGYGVGPALTYAPGRIYLAGPYGGQPLSLVVVNSATPGAFDLGTIVLRFAFKVNPRTAQLEIDSSSSDPIPPIIEGFPLKLRDVRVSIDRPGFVHNPTGCEPSELVSTLTGAGRDLDDPADDEPVVVHRHFQLLNCLELGYNPRLSLRLLGRARRNAHPALRVALRARGGDASMKRIVVTMPRALFLAQDHIRGICTRPQFAAERCPSDSAYGKAAVFTPLFDRPLRGHVYLRSSVHRLPDMVASLRSGAVRIVLEGRIGPSKQGGIRAFFDNVPDAPINHFVMHLNGGKRGLLVNSVNICRNPVTATVKSLGQNHRGVIYTSTLRGQCRKRKRAGRR